MNLFGSAQSQAHSLIPGMIMRTHAGAWKFIDPDPNVLKMAHAANSNALIVVRRFTGQAVYDAVADPYKYGIDYARQLRDKMGDGYYEGIAGEGENEPVAWTEEAARKLNEFGIGFSEECGLLKIRPVYPNFSEGHFEVFNPDGLTIDSTRMNLIAPSLRKVKAARGFYGRHEYGWPSMKTDWVEPKGWGYRCGRHIADLLAMPADLSDIDMLATELGIDKLIVGQIGGWAAAGDMQNFVNELNWWRRIAAPNMKAGFVFGYQLYGSTAEAAMKDDPGTRFAVIQQKYNNAMHRYNAVKHASYEQPLSPNAMSVNWSSYDMARTPEDQALADQWFAETAVLDPVVPPPDPTPQPEVPMIRFDLLSEKVPFLTKCALKYHWTPVMEEKSFRNGDNETDPKFLFLACLEGYIVTQEGKYAPGDELYFALDFKPVDPSTTPSPTPTPTPKPAPIDQVALNTALAKIGAYFEPQTSHDASNPSWALSGVAGRSNINAFIQVTLLDENGDPMTGVNVCDLFPDGNGSIIPTDGNGNVRFQLSAKAAFTEPGTGPHEIFVVDYLAYKDEDMKQVHWTNILSDRVKSLGDFRGSHQEIQLQMKLRKAA